MKKYDVAIIGAGPAGVVAAKSAAEKGLSVLILERGRDLTRRRDLISGWFGKGIVDVDRFEITDPLLRSPKTVAEILKIISKISNVNIKTNKKYFRFPAKTGFALAKFYFEAIKNNVDIVFNTEALKIEKEKNFVIHTTGAKFITKYCIIATGKNSIGWINYICEYFGIKTFKNAIKVGVRVEVPTFRIRDALEQNDDINMTDGRISTEDARINSFVGEWEDSNILSAFGHTMLNKKSTRTNFMVGIQTSEDISETIRNIKIINVLANDRIKCERVYDYMEGRSILKHIDVFNQLKPAFENLEKTFPFLIDYATMHIPEVKIPGIFPVDLSMKTQIKNLYGVGECTSRVGTMVGAMASGLIAIRTILKE